MPWYLSDAALLEKLTMRTVMKGRVCPVSSRIIRRLEQRLEIAAMIAESLAC